MKELYRSRPDGSRYYGNGVWGPSATDLQRADLIFANEETKTKERPNNDLLFVSQESVVGRLLQTMYKVRPPAKFAIPSSMATVLLMSACSGGGEKSTQELENKDSSGYTLPFPEGETWFLTGGPHADGLSSGVRYAIDIAPPEVTKCPTDGSRVVIDNRVVTASASGQVIVAGDDKNRSDPSHSMIKIEDTNGLTEVYIHLANTKLKKGDKVSQGASLGNPSCEYPPGGRNEGAHIHVGLEKDGQAIPIDGVVVGGWIIRNEPKNYDGTMTKSGEKTRTADTRRCPDDKACGGIRNDLTNEPIKQVLGESQTSVEKPVEQGWTRLKSRNLPYTIDYPSSWQRNDWYPGGIRIDNKPIGDEFLGEIFKISGDEVQVRVVILAGEFDQASFGVENAIIDGQKASKYESVDPFTHDLQYLFVRDGKLWQISFDNNRSVFDKELPTFEKMLASFKLRDGPILKPTLTQTSSPTPMEKSTKQEWIRFTSPNYLYRISYPSNWTYTNDKVNKMDVFNGPPVLGGYQRMQIYPESVSTYYTFDDYVREIADQQRAKSTRGWTQKEYEQTLKNYKDFAYEYSLEIDGKKIPVIQNELDEITIGGDKTYRAFEVITDYTFIWKGNKWHIVISRPTYVGGYDTQREQELATIPDSIQILSSFKPIERLP